MNRSARTCPTLLATLLIAALAPPASAQFCPGGPTYFSGNYSLSGCTVGTCWSPNPFPSSTRITGSQYPSTNYACATTTPVSGALENTLYTYDANGNLTVVKDPLAHSTTNAYDALNRLTQVTDPASGLTKYAYNLNNILNKVTDPRNLATNYTIDGFGETTTLASSDTGTATSTYDPAGNLLTRLDSRGVTATYTVDAINRVTQVVYSKTGTTSEMHTFTYDQGTSGKGRLTQLTDTAGTTSWTYEAHGRVTSKVQTVGNTATVSYAYNAAGQLQTLTTPSGQAIGYTYTNGRVSGITLNGAALITGAITEPFGPLSTWQWGNGLVTLRVYDLGGRLTSWEYRDGVSILRNDVTWDIASRVTANANPADAALGCAFQYDNLDRLTVSQQGSPVTTTQQFGYDAVGNRRNFTLNGTATNYSYSSSSNQLLSLTGSTTRSYVYDAAGNPTTIGALTYVYNNANRLVTVKNGATVVASYKVNALGQRVEKNAGGTITRYVYDEQRHLLGEYDSAGKIIQETVWLEDMPIATLRPTGASANPTPINTYFVLADHLGSPRAVVRPGDNKFMWRWDNVDSFGDNAANENPAGQGQFRYALRFPGQYYDPETASHYNDYRDYDPLVGRYEQSDPIGIWGGLNTYVYVADAPITYFDSTGKNIHGNWCGPGGGGPVQDAVDQCCKDHDECYDRCKADWKNKVLGTGGTAMQTAIASCDKGVCACLALVQPKGDAERRGKERVSWFFNCTTPPTANQKPKQ
jgi:RHS repeat-associated protein